MVLAIEFPPSQPFRLLDLPREVRDKIYHGMLCDWRKGALLGHILVDGKVRFAPMRHNIEPNILRANKQIYQEAKQVLLKGNQFVHIRMVVRSGFTIPDIFVNSQSQIPLVSAGLECAAVFQDLVVMTHFIDFPKNPPHMFKVVDGLDIIILHRDLERFCQFIALHDSIQILHSSQSKHQVTIHNPFAKTLSPDFLSRKNQERLLEPYPKQLQGYVHFNINGHVEPDLAEAVVAKTREDPPPPDPDAFLEYVRRQIELGDQSFRDGDHEKAKGLWKYADMVLFQATHRRTWSRLKEAGGKSFTDQVTELAFELESNRAQGVLMAMQGIPLQIQISQGRSYFMDLQEADKPSHLRSRLRSLAQDLMVLCLKAQRAGPLLGTDWAPSNEQRAKLCYRQAQGLRLSDARVEVVEDMINRAAELLPDDPLIQSEAQHIRVWKARVQGG